MGFNFPEKTFDIKTIEFGIKKRTLKYAIDFQRKLFLAR